MEPDAGESLFTDKAPARLLESGVELQHRLELLNKGVEKVAQARMDEEGLRAVAHAVLVEYADCFRAVLRAEDPPVDVPPMKVQLRSGARPVHAHARQAAHEKNTFLAKIVPGTNFGGCGSGRSGVGIDVCKPCYGSCQIVVGQRESSGSSYGCLGSFWHHAQS